MGIDLNNIRVNPVSVPITLTTEDHIMGFPTLRGNTGVGISSIEKTGTLENVDTYTITMTNGETFTFDVTNGVDGQDGAPGVGITSIVKTGTSGLVDTYTITFDDGSNTTYEITNGEDGQDGAPGATGNGIATIIKTGESGLVDTYTITYTNGTTTTFTVTNGADGDSAWGNITGTLSNQTDLQTALDAKADSSDLGDMAVIDDAPSDSKVYGRSDGDWAEVVSSIDWGDIGGTLANQTDLQSALNAKQDTLTFDTTPTASSANPVTSGGIKTALDNKADNSILGDAFSTSAAYAVGDYVIYQGALYRFTSAHTAGAWDSTEVTQVVAMEELADLQALVESRQKFYVSGTASAGSSFTITDARINSEHWRVPKNGIYFGTPGNVTTGVHWVTNVANHTVTLEATFAGATTVEIDLEWYQNVQSA